MATHRPDASRNARAWLSRWAFLVAACQAIACGSASHSAERCTPGREGCPCRETGRCNDGLECREDPCPDCAEPTGICVAPCEPVLDPDPDQWNLTNWMSEAAMQSLERADGAMRLFTALFEAHATCESTEIEIPLSEPPDSYFYYPRFVVNWNSVDSDTAASSVSLVDPAGTLIDESSEGWTIYDASSHVVYHHPDEALTFGTWRIGVGEEPGRSSADALQYLVLVNTHCSGPCREPADPDG